MTQKLSVPQLAIENASDAPPGEGGGVSAEYGTNCSPLVSYSELQEGRISIIQKMAAAAAAAALHHRIIARNSLRTRRNIC